MYKKLTFVVVSICFVLFISANSSTNKKDDYESREQALAKLSYVLEVVQKYYVDDQNMSDIVNKAIAGLMSELDAHSSYLDKKRYKGLKQSTKGEFGGLGIVIGMRDGVLTVISPIDDTPAKKAGIESSDIILKIDDKSTIGMKLDEAVGLMRGKPGTNIELTIVRKGERKPIAVPITRDIIKVKSVFAKTIQNKNMLYLRISSFDSKVVKELKKRLNNNKNHDGIVLDLRDNPGGLLDQAIGVVDMFVSKGKIVSQKSQDKTENKIYKATKYATQSDKPMVVLVNGGSASASEIVAGALQDHKRAIIVGDKTFGKGSVQQILPIANNRLEAIKITISRYYLPSGRTIQAVGISPDIESFKGKSVSKDKDEFDLKEADLKKHLKGELEKINKKPQSSKKDEKNEKDKNTITNQNLQEDNQLNDAVNVLKALIITKGN
ncbi:MAG: peptidase S41 [Epsilonproteobacteria bacterium]|nr:MAG: peptidase S41 [Campylobacterota bacterium]